MELKKSVKVGLSRFLIAASSLMITISCIGIRMDSDIDLGDGYYYVQDYPQSICKYPKPGNVVLPIGESDDIVVRVQYNDSIIVATCSPDYYSYDSTVYVIKKTTGDINLVEDVSIYTCKFDDDIKNRRRYDK